MWDIGNQWQYLTWTHAKRIKKNKIKLFTACRLEFACKPRRFNAALDTSEGMPAGEGVGDIIGDGVPSESLGREGTGGGLLERKRKNTKIISLIN